MTHVHTHYIYFSLWKRHLLRYINLLNEGRSYTQTFVSAIPISVSGKLLFIMGFMVWGLFDLICSWSNWLSNNHMDDDDSILEQLIFITKHIRWKKINKIVWFNVLVTIKDGNNSHMVSQGLVTGIVLISHFSRSFIVGWIIKRIKLELDSKLSEAIMSCTACWNHTMSFFSFSFLSIIPA